MADSIKGAANKTTDHLIEYWDAIAGKKVFTTPIPLERLKSSSLSDRIVEVGCGYGRVLSSLRDHGFTNLGGCDPSPKMISAAKKNLDHDIDLHVASGSSLPFADESADIVLLLAVLTCIIEPDSEYETLSEIHRILKPGGLLIVNDFLFLDDLSSYHLREDQHGKYGVFSVDGMAQVKHMSKSRLKSILSDFEIEDFKEQPFVTMNGTIANGAIVIVRKKSLRRGRPRPSGRGGALPDRGAGYKPRPDLPSPGLSSPG